nr:Tm-1-like ATP-binding domain-containing protein [Jiangella asiatica]
MLLGTLDTKGEEYAYLRDLLTARRCDVLTVDAGVLGEPRWRADVPADEVARAAGHELQELRGLRDRGAAMESMAAGAARVVTRLRQAGRVDAVMAAGGSNAAFLMSAVCAELPVGMPKLLVSTITAGDTRPYVGQSDLTLMYPVVDLGGLNRVSRLVLANAADACAGMAHGPRETTAADRHTVAISMFGVTTACGTTVRELITAAGAEALTFHATGVGGASMEALIRSGHVQAVADMTTTELADDLLGGVCSAGPGRLTAAAEHGVPQVVSLGALDMVNFGPPSTVPAAHGGRLLHRHNPMVTLMRTSAEECAELGRQLAVKLNRATGPSAVLIPTRGFSQISTPGQVFHDPQADAALIDALTASLGPHVYVRRFNTHINDPRLAAAAARILIDWLKAGAS